MKHNIVALIHELQDEANRYDSEFKGYEAVCVNGILRAYFSLMHDALPDDHFLKEYIPAQLVNEIDEMRERAVMKKLES
jgi:hypothetical protein